jgi:hypothetical protein
MTISGRLCAPIDKLTESNVGFADQVTEGSEQKSSS